MFGGENYPPGGPWRTGRSMVTDLTRQPVQCCLQFMICTCEHSQVRELLNRQLSVGIFWRWRDCKPGGLLVPHRLQDKLWLGGSAGEARRDSGGAYGALPGGNWDSEKRARQLWAPYLSGNPITEVGKAEWAKEWGKPLGLWVEQRV